MSSPDTVDVGGTRRPKETTTPDATVREIQERCPDWRPWDPACADGGFVAWDHRFVLPPFQPSTIPDGEWQCLVLAMDSPSRSYNEIAEITGIGRKTAYNRILRAMCRLAGRPTTSYRHRWKRREPGMARWRTAVLDRDGEVCQHCGSTDQLEAHHVIAYADAPARRHEVTNGLTLCRSCHRRQHAAKDHSGCHLGNDDR